MQTFLYSALHFLTDFLCGFAVFARFLGKGRDIRVLFAYNFCAFAMQLPLGVLLDLLSERRRRAGGNGAEDSPVMSLPLLFSAAGLMLSLPGAFLSPVLLGLGNALFHIGGGVAAIGSDRENRHRGRDMGFFTAPGALGLFLGSALGKSGPGWLAIPVVLLTAGLFAAGIWMLRREEVRPKPDLSAFLRTLPHIARTSYEEETPVSGKAGFRCVLAVTLCFAAVVLRSLTGFAVSFPWKTGFLMGFLASLEVMIGKMLGGIICENRSPRNVTLLSLALAAVCYISSSSAAFGLTALLLFNMTMPVTLWLIASRFRELPGFSFGLLTLALFLGFIPELCGYEGIPDAGSTGAILCVVSIFLLAMAFRTFRREAAHETGDS